MKRRFIQHIAFLCCLSISSFGQIDTLFFDKDFDTSERKTASFYRLIAVQSDTIFKVFTFYKSTRMQSIGYSKITDYKYIKDWDYRKVAKYVEFYETGKRKFQGFYDGLDLIGRENYFHENGKLFMVKDFSFQKDVGFVPEVISIYDSTGNQTVTDGVGFAVLEKDSVLEKGNFKRGQKDGTWLGEHKAGRFKFEEKYQFGKLLNGKTMKDTVVIDYKEVFIPPQFRNGKKGLRSFIAKHKNYPLEAKRNKIEGDVFVKFLIDENGSIQNPVIITSPDARLSTEVIRVVKKMQGLWTPAFERGLPIKSNFTLGFYFYRDTAIPTLEEEVSEFMLDE